MDFFECGDAIIPFQKRCGFAHELDRVAVHLPDQIKNRMVVGIENIFLKLRVTGNVYLPDTMMRDVV